MIEEKRDPGFHRYRHRAMATLFEVMIAGEDPGFAEKAAFAAFQEIDRLERELSRYLPNSDIARINNLPPHGSLRVGLDAFGCLQLGLQYREETGGAFDVTLGALVDCWVGKDKSLLHPSSAEIERARERSGRNRLELDEATVTVHVHDPTPLVDLGAIGKGYAVDRAVELLKDWGVESALVHGGTSSAYAFGEYPNGHGWPVTLSNPENGSEVLQTVFLQRQSLGGSGIKKGLHIINPRTARTVRGRRAAWVCSGSAAESDAVSTACMVMTRAEIKEYCGRHPATWAAIVEEGTCGSADELLRFGPAIEG
jgi:thiamine biosynthesis lipoprotein